MATFVVNCQSRTETSVCQPFQQKDSLWAERTGRRTRHHEDDIMCAFEPGPILPPNVLSLPFFFISEYPNWQINKEPPPGASHWLRLLLLWPFGGGSVNEGMESHKKELTKRQQPSTQRRAPRPVSSENSWAKHNDQRTFSSAQKGIA